MGLIDVPANIFMKCYICDECNANDMKFTGDIAKEVYAGEGYTHTCNGCGYVCKLDTQYPKQYYSYNVVAKLK